MKRLLAVGACLLALALPAVAAAHPLGNFTTNRYVEVVVSGNHVFVRYALDLAEIPTFQAKPDVARLGRAGYSGRLAATVRDGLRLELAGSRQGLVELDRRISFPQGVAGLHTTRLEVVYDAGTVSRSSAPLALELTDASFPERIGWREIVVRAERGARITASSAPAASVTDRLRSYPKNLLQSPADVREASARAEPGASSGVAPVLETPAASAASRPTSKSETGFAALIAWENLSLGLVVFSVALAMFWGAAHALTPGHGKAIVAAYLVGTKGRPRDALALGGIVTVTHTIGVFALGLVTLLLSEFIVPETLYPWMNLISALLVVAVGVAVLRQRVLLAVRGGSHGAHHHHHHGHHHHDHHHHGIGHDHGHSHVPESGSGARGLLAVGISGGLIPCPTALVVLLAAISLHRVVFGLVLIVAFSVGLAAVISGIGLLAIAAKQTFQRASFEGRLVRALPAVTALLIPGLGIAMMVRSLPGVI